MQIVPQSWCVLSLVHNMLLVPAVLGCCWLHSQHYDASIQAIRLSKSFNGRDIIWLVNAYFSHEACDTCAMLWTRLWQIELYCLNGSIVCTCRVNSDWSSGKGVCRSLASNSIKCEQYRMRTLTFIACVCKNIDSIIMFEQITTIKNWHKQFTTMCARALEVKICIEKNWERVEQWKWI